MSNWYPQSRPRAADGIKARSTRGAIAKTWWSERFISSLEALQVGGRLSRGKNYARRGQVLSLEVAAGAVTAAVQGSRARPYRVRIGLPTLGKTEWTAVTDALANNAWFAAKLLAGEMPSDIEEVFAGAGVALFPASTGELSMDCSCPDWRVPCKHLAAVFYLLAEEFDEDPFLVLAWRGRDRVSLLDALAAHRTGGVTADKDDAGMFPALSEQLDSFWVVASVSARDPAPATEPDALLGQLPPRDLMVRNVALTDLLRPVYEAMGAELAGDDFPQP